MDLLYDMGPCEAVPINVEIESASDTKVNSSKDGCDCKKCQKKIKNDGKKGFFGKFKKRKQEIDEQQPGL